MIRAILDFMASDTPATPGQAAIIVFSFLAITCFNVCMVCKFSRRAGNESKQQENRKE